jgi:hypothetical protein
LTCDQEIKKGNGNRDTTMLMMLQQKDTHGGIIEEISCVKLLHEKGDHREKDHGERMSIRKVLHLRIGLLFIPFYFLSPNRTNRTIHFKKFKRTWSKVIIRIFFFNQFSISTQRLIFARIKKGLVLHHTFRTKVWHIWYFGSQMTIVLTGGRLSEKATDLLRRNSEKLLGSDWPSVMLIFSSIDSLSVKE